MTVSLRLDGILAGFGQLYLKTPEGFVANEEASIHVDVVADLWLFRPKVGAVLKAVVNKKGSSFVGCLVHGCFNVPCYK